MVVERRWRRRVRRYCCGSGRGRGLFFLLLAASAVLSYLKRAGETSSVERALIKAISSCFGIMLGRSSKHEDS
jgi:hypothetical protein